ncbi:hypothetical protein HYU12_05385, partial [Candidatus Woesearchaeota archaeon]|nr:hypothetical protein [Candidatus Woesearchaeota archaeon]
SSHVYEAETPGFSIFAISGEKIAETLEPLKPSLPSLTVVNQSNKPLVNESFVSPVPSQPAQPVFSEPAAPDSSSIKPLAVFGFALAIALAWFLRGSKRVSGRRVKGKSL